MSRSASLVRNLTACALVWVLPSQQFSYAQSSAVTVGELRERLYNNFGHSNSGDSIMSWSILMSLVRDQMSNEVAGLKALQRSSSYVALTTSNDLLAGIDLQSARIRRD